jgi:hypothetical protein
VDPDPLREDRRGEPAVEREQRGVPALAAAIDPRAPQSSQKRLRGEVLPGVPARQQPPLTPGPAELLLTQRVRDRAERLGERDLPATALAVAAVASGAMLLVRARRRRSSCQTPTQGPVG